MWFRGWEEENRRVGYEVNITMTVAVQSYAQTVYREGKAVGKAEVEMKEAGEFKMS